MKKVLAAILWLVLTAPAWSADPLSPRHIPINTGTGWSDSPFISSDGKRLYFMYSRYNFGPFLTSGGKVLPKAEGPDRPGLHKSSVNPFDESDIYMSTKNSDGVWSEPVAMSFNGPYGDSSGMEINGGRTFIWLQGNGQSNDIVIAQKNADGSWGKPVKLPPSINKPGATQDNPYLSSDGKALWFTSDRKGGLGSKDIWFSYNADGRWSDPVVVSMPINSRGEEDQFFLAPNSMDVYWNGPRGIMHCLSNGSNCGGEPTAVKFSGPLMHRAEVSITGDGKTMYFAAVDPQTVIIRIMSAAKQADGTWGDVKSVD